MEVSKQSRSSVAWGYGAGKPSVRKLFQIARSRIGKIRCWMWTIFQYEPLMYVSFFYLHFSIFPFSLFLFISLFIFFFFSFFFFVLFLNFYWPNVTLLYLEPTLYLASCPLCCLPTSGLGGGCIATGGISHII